MYSRTRKTRSRIGKSKQVLAVGATARALEPLLEGHVAQLEDHEVVLDAIADRGRDEVRVVRLARGVERHDVRVPLHALEQLLLHLEPERVLGGDVALQHLDRDLPAERRLGLDPALFAEVGLREAAGAELDGLPVLVDDEPVGPGAHDVSRRRSPGRCGSSGGANPLGRVAHSGRAGAAARIRRPGRGRELRHDEGARHARDGLLLVVELVDGVVGRFVARHEPFLGAW